MAQGAIGQVELMTSAAHDGLPNYSSHQSDRFRYLLSDEECAWVMSQWVGASKRGAWGPGRKTEDRAKHSR